jgi:hypothetical protein
MKNGALVIVMILGAFQNAFYHPALAQSSVGGPTKQNAVGGPVKQNSPVVPTNKREFVSVSPPSPVKCPTGPCAAKGTNR